jgi:hypothetical protein
MEEVTPAAHVPTPMVMEEPARTRAEILAAVDIAEASLARGEGRVITQESMRELAEHVKQRGRPDRGSMSKRKAEMTLGSAGLAARATNLS